MIMLPLIGGFNDGKYIEPKKRNIIKMAKPPETDPSSISHYEEIIGFDFEIYNLTPLTIGRKVLRFYVIEGMSLAEATEKMVFGYKRFNKKKTLDLSKK